MADPNWPLCYDRKMREGVPECHFECTCCGECCRDDQIIRLNGEDMDILVQHLGLKNRRALLENGVIELAYEDPGFQRPRLKFRKKPFRFCPFQINHIEADGQLKGFCSLHPHNKPLVCQLAPLAREVVDDGNTAIETWLVVEPVAGCPGMGHGADITADQIAVLRDRLDRETIWMRNRLANVDGDPLS